MLQSDSICLAGSSLEKVKKDGALLREQTKLVAGIKSDQYYKVAKFDGSGHFGTQLGGQRAKGEMWKQALEVWKWNNEYSATWEMAFNELTWTVRSVTVKYRYVVTSDGKITINYWFSDVLDLRPSWGDRSLEYNAICFVLGFLYHDVLGGSDELKVKAYWSTSLN
ncbi:hypothetical protein E1171_17815 [Cytophagales bacterium RKSG123]|nr:hypothetical protein [Xanthovirga aplysinae]